MLLSFAIFQVILSKYMDIDLIAQVIGVNDVIKLNVQMLIVISAQRQISLKKFQCRSLLHSQSTFKSKLI